MRKCLLLFLLLLILSYPQSFSQAADTLPIKHNIKLKLPLNYVGFFSERFATGLTSLLIICHKN